MPHLPLRIAVLECDEPLPGTKARLGNYGGVFTQFLHAGADILASAGTDPASTLAISRYDVWSAQEYPSLADIDAILLTGSKYSAFDDDPWVLKLVAFVKTILSQDRVRIIGVCYGHQIVGRALGGRLARNEDGWEISVMNVDLTEKGQQIFAKSSLQLHQMHRDILLDCPEGVELLGYTQKCRVQGLYAPKRLITLQGHPEFTGEIVREIVLFRNQTGIFSDEERDEALGRVDNLQDGAAISRAFLTFLLED